MSSPRSISSRRIVSCIVIFYLSATIAAHARQAANPNDLYRERENPVHANEAADVWATQAAAGANFEAEWKLARACYWLGTQGPEHDRRAELQHGVDAGEAAAKLSPSKPEGHFWLAANMGALAESFGFVQGIKYRGRIKDELERVLAIDPAWQEGSADRALGWWYHRVPGLFGGSNDKAEAHLRQALTYDQTSTATLFFLGEVLADRGKQAEARAMWQRVLDAPLDPDWAPEDRDFKAKAAARLE